MSVSLILAPVGWGWACPALTATTDGCQADEPDHRCTAAMDGGGALIGLTAMDDGGVGLRGLPAPRPTGAPEVERCPQLSSHANMCSNDVRRSCNHPAPAIARLWPRDPGADPLACLRAAASSGPRARA